MKKIFLNTFTYLLVLGCLSKKEGPKTAIPVEVGTPAQSPSAEPFLFTDAKEKVYLSWIEKEDTVHHFKYAQKMDSGWTTPALIASSSNWFVNWADYPMLATDGKGNFISYVLTRSGKGTFAYDIQVFSSTDNGVHWDNTFILHDDGKKGEHGFVTLLPYDGNMFVTWLDGRNTVIEGKETMKGNDHGGHHGAMSLRAAIIDYTGKKRQEWELDNKTCDCCQTTAALTSLGPVVIYRDRSDEEIRDMSIVRMLNGSWTTPQTIYADQWKIEGCPVNGPRAAAQGNTLAVVWFSAPEGKASVKMMVSSNGGETFGDPIRIDEGHPLGRVDIVMLDNNTSMVSWLEGSEIKAVTVNHNGNKETAITVTGTSEARSSGFPQMTKTSNGVLFAWTDDKEKVVKTAVVLKE